MGPQPSQIASSLSQKYEALHEAFTNLSIEAAQFQNSVPVADAAQRGLFNSLSRIVAFSDHVHVALSLMGEDVQSIEATYGVPESRGIEELDDCFDEWFTKLTVANVKVH